MSSELKFKSLEIRNFLAIGNQTQTVYLDGQGTVTISGENRDIPGNSSNGAGKTTIINALCYALYNKAFDQISLQRLVNSTNSIKNTQMEVRLFFSKDNCEYEIYRARGEGYSIELKRNGEDITPGKGVIECDNLIEDIIGMSYDLFVKTIIFSGNSPAFLQLPIALQRKTIEELFNITMLSEKAQKLKDNIRENEQDIKIGEIIIKQQQASINLHERQVLEAEARVKNWFTQREKQINEINETLSLISEIDFVKEQELHNKRFKLESEKTSLVNKILPLKKDLQIITDLVEKHLNEVTHLEFAKCPYCLQDYAAAQDKIVSLNLSIEKDSQKISDLECLILELDSQKKKSIEALLEVNTLIKHQNLDELLEARDNISQHKRKLVELESSNNPFEEVRDSLIINGVPETDFIKVDDLKRKLDHQQFLLKLLTDKNSFLRHRIINKNIPFLNARLNSFTQTLGLPHLVKFDADMSCTVTEFGRELDFGNLSAGEKKRVNTAMALAFRDVLHRLHFNTNLILIDELDGGLDVPGIDAIITTLKDISRSENTSVFVISHHPQVAGRLERNLLVIKQQGFSSIVMDD